METSLSKISYNLARAPSTKQTNGYPDGGQTFDWSKRVYDRSKKRASSKIILHNAADDIDCVCGALQWLGESRYMRSRCA